EVQCRSAEPLLFAADLERGAGQQFRGATSLPPAAAFGELDDPGLTRRAGELTAREAAALGVHWIYAPVADLDLEPHNPIVGSRAFSAGAARAAEHVAAWIEGCRAGGALSCAKHFPGHGRTVADSHLELPRVAASRADLAADLLPFQAAVQAGVDSVMSAHVAYPALDASGAPATLSHPILTELLRLELGFLGPAVSDALIMEGVLAHGGGEGQAAVKALAAGCDALLYPSELERVIRVIEAAIGRELAEGRLTEAIARVDDLARRATRLPGGEWGRPHDREWALDVAVRAIRVLRGRPQHLPAAIDLLTVDDDLGGPYAPPPRDAFPAALRGAGIEVREVERPARDRPALVALYADIRGWKGRPGVSAWARERVAQAAAARPDTMVVLFGHPRLAENLPGASILAAWGGEPLMQEAAARHLAARP
ncbi:MAG: glycoside hydrolase family 3 protein, partial [Gemmatimonadetes bacterium]|nr:glycoside hydrolase family 3 protein [Gemmatimonadota bacterium]